MTSALVYAALAGAVAVVNAAYGRLRAPAPRRSHAWFGCLAAPVMLLIALRKLFAFSWAGWAGLVAAAVLGHVIGWQLGARDALPSPVRWRLAVYAGLLGALLIGLCEPLHAAHRATAGTGYQRLEVDEPTPGFDLIDQRGERRLENLCGRAIVLTFPLYDLHR
jgi:O-antigen ligase